MSVDVLVLEWTTELTRDRLVSALISNYLSRYGISVQEGPLQNGRHIIDKVKPKVLLLVNTIGAVTSLEVAKYAKRKCVCVVSLFGEGNFNGDRIEQFVWGHNTQKQVVDHFRLVWSPRALQLLQKSYPELADTSYVAGSVGADNYVIGGGEYLIDQKIKECYQCVVGVGCWNFCLVDELDHRYYGFSEFVGHKEVARIRKDAVLFNGELKSLIKSCPEVLFLIKEHPHKANLKNASGVDDLEHFKNVIFTDKDESIMNCIKSSDIWLTYESTTSLEAWLEGKPTGLLNPTGTKFISNWRSPIYKGQPNFPDAASWKYAISEFIEKGRLPGFAEKCEIRLNLLDDVFGYSDGLNHVRVGNFIISILKGEIPYESSYERIRIKEYLTSKIKNMIWYSSAFIEMLGLWGRIPHFFHRFRVRAWNRKELFSYMDDLNSRQSKYYRKVKGSLDRINVVKVCRDE